MDSAQENSPVVVFDFDKTLSYRDTVFGFFWAAAPSGAGKWVKAAIYWGLVIAAKLGLVRLEVAKQFGVRCFLRHHDAASLGMAAQQYASTIALNKIYHEQYLPMDGQAWIVSASLDCYLKTIFPPERVIATVLRWDSDGRPSGIQNTCQGEEKVRRLADHGVRSIDRLYTDSAADAPLASIAVEVYKVKGDAVERVLSLD